MSARTKPKSRHLQLVLKAIFVALAVSFTLASSAFAGTADQDICPPIEGWIEISAQNPRFVVLGEFHGTAEAPAFAGELLCSLARHGERVLLAIEISSMFDPQLQDAFKAPSEQFARKLKAAEFGEREDGVTSAAMFDLVARAKSLKDEGLDVGIVAFNGSKDETQANRHAHLPGQGPHEAAQAENIFNAAKEGGYDRVIVLVGNLHAEKVRVAPGGTQFEPMAVKLARKGALVSLNMRDAGGSAWNCQVGRDFKFEPGKPVPDDAIECASHPARRHYSSDKGPHMALGPFQGDEKTDRFDGYFWVGPISASPPAFPNED